MKILTVVCILLALACLLLLVRLIVIKSGLRTIREELELNRNEDYNRQIRVTLADRDLCAAAVEINRNLDYQKQKKLAAGRAETQLQQSVSDIAHDMRTPLTVIKGNLQLLGQEEALSEKGQERLRICREKSDVLKEMVDDFFELSVLESDHAPAALHDVDITNVLVQFVVDHEELIRANNLEPELCIPQRSVFIRADEQLLMRMLGNLLGNTVKYAKDTFCIQLDAVDEGKRCRIRFSNAVADGRQPDASRLFERSYRGDQARGGSGAGLGLYIVKLLADKQGADVSAVCENHRLAIDLYFRAAADGKHDE